LVSAVAHFFVSISGSKIHERVAHFFVDIYNFFLTFMISYDIINVNIQISRIKKPEQSENAQAF